MAGNLAMTSRIASSFGLVKRWYSSVSRRYSAIEPCSCSRLLSVTAENASRPGMAIPCPAQRLGPFRAIMVRPTLTLPSSAWTSACPWDDSRISARPGPRRSIGLRVYGKVVQV